jgi:hypothetical protein
MGQTPTASFGRSDPPFNEWMPPMGMSPGGFTPIRTNFQKANPMFSPPQSMEGRGIFGPSPSMNNLSYQSFGYGRTPVNNFGRPNQGFMPRPNGQGNGQNQDNKRQGQGNNGLFDLNPFG